MIKAHESAINDCVKQSHNGKQYEHCHICGDTKIDGILYFVPMINKYICNDCKNYQISMFGPNDIYDDIKLVT